MPSEKKEKAQAKAPENDSNLMGAISEFFSLSVIVPLILYFVKKDDKFVRFHSLQALVFGIVIQAGAWVLTVVLAVATFFLGGIGGFCGMFVYLVGIVVALFATYKAFSGEMWEMPIIGAFVKKYV